jgi:5-methylcytosine-specific restriction endonuclease McrA
MAVTIRMEGLPGVLKFISSKKRNIEKGITDGALQGAEVLADEVRASIAGQRAEPRSVDTGAFLESVNIATTATRDVTVFSDVEHACLIGAGQSIYEPINRTSGRIGNYKYNYILSKDGFSHKINNILSRRNFNRNKIVGIKIKIDNMRNPLFVTENHLILCLRNEELQWIKAKDINLNDYIFKKRVHNYNINKSKRIKLICKCGKEFERTENYINRNINKFENFYCSKECRHKFGKHDFSKGKKWNLTFEQRQKHIGQYNPQWKNGSSKLPYDWRFNNLLKDIVKKRDNYICQDCGRCRNQVKYLIVHHKDFNKMNSNLDNLITLCPSCHGKYNKLDCEFPDINLNVFKPIHPLKIERIELIRKGKSSLPKLYDISVQDENSYIAGGVLIHNSFLEFGTSRIPARRHFSNSADRVKNEVVAKIESSIKSKL